jgi:hypothetical protein
MEEEEGAVGERRDGREGAGEAVGEQEAHTDADESIGEGVCDRRTGLHDGSEHEHCFVDTRTLEEKRYRAAQRSPPHRVHGRDPLKISSKRGTPNASPHRDEMQADKGTIVMPVRSRICPGLNPSRQIGHGVDLPPERKRRVRVSEDVT